MRLPDFNAAAASFRARGWQADRLADAVWRFRRTGAKPRLRLLLSAGVHGDETAPIEMLMRQLPDWAHDAAALDLDLMVAIGNLDAVQAGKRFVRYDMNRMFGAHSAKLSWGAESDRAQLLQHCAGSWLMEQPGTPTVHLDLHTTIRPSLKPTFAIVPGEDAKSPLVRWLAGAGLDAAVLSPGPNVTFSAFTARFGAQSCTAELGKAAAFGDNDLGVLSRFAQALDRLVRWREGAWPPVINDRSPMPVYRVTREIVRNSEHFELLVPTSAPNFTPVSGQEVARDGQCVVRAGEHDVVLFPNPSVALGLRAGLLAAPVTP